MRILNRLVITGLVLIWVITYSLGQTKYYGTFVKAQPYMFSKPLFGDRIDLPSGSKPELIGKEESKIKVYVNNQYGYVYPEDLVQNNELIEFKKVAPNLTAMKKEEEIVKSNITKQSVMDSLTKIYGKQSLKATVVNNNSALYDSPNGEIMRYDLNHSDMVLITDYTNEFFVKVVVVDVKFTNIEGFVLKANLDISDSAHAVINKRINSLKAQQAKEEEQERKLAMEKRRKELTTKYGSDIANRIIKNGIWIGMKDKYAVESLGQPNRINRSVGSWGVHEQWVYSDLYLNFENGILQSYQDTY